MSRMTRSRAGRRHPSNRRYGRIGLLVASLALTLGAVVAAVGLAPYPVQQERAQAGQLSQAEVLDVPPRAGQLLPQPTPDTGSPPTADPAVVPLRSGAGRRVVYDMGAQRVWLVRADDTVLDHYPVSGSLLENLDAGRYEVYSRSVDAIGYTGESTMRHMVRFTHGDNAAIGFHDIPLDRQGDRVQSMAQLGTPLSDGCIRQRPRDAKQLWTFAPVGTRVVVLD